MVTSYYALHDKIQCHSTSWICATSTNSERDRENNRTRDVHWNVISYVSVSVHTWCSAYVLSSSNACTNNTIPKFKFHWHLHFPCFVFEKSEYCIFSSIHSNPIAALIKYALLLLGASIIASPSTAASSYTSFPIIVHFSFHSNRTIRTRARLSVCRISMCRVYVMWRIQTHSSSNVTSLSFVLCCDLSPFVIVFAPALIRIPIYN